MNCDICQTRNPDGARFCLNCGTALNQLCLHCQAQLPSVAHFCTSCGQPVRLSSPEDAARHSRLAAAAPAPLVEKAQAAEPRASERRLVTSLFVDVVGSMALAEKLGSAEWAAVMNGALDQFYPAIYRYEGTIAHLQGDALLAFFGSPVVHEDDPVRAVRAAMDLLTAAQEYASEVQRKFGVGFAVRLGLHTGTVIVGPVGGDMRYEYRAMGGAVNLAARLQDAAQPMTALMSEDTQRFVQPFFDSAVLGPISIKGMDQTVLAYQVLQAKAAPGQVRGLVSSGLESPMVGRDAELTTLTQLCDAVRAGLGRAVLLVGEPGLGKTRLIAEWKQVIHSAEHGNFPLWAEGRCLSYGQGLAYHLLMDLLRDLAGIAEGADEADARTALRAFTTDLFGGQQVSVYPFLAHLLKIALEGEERARVMLLDPQALQTRYLGAMRRVLQVLSLRRPLVLVLEDLHWADPSSADLLIRLLPMASSAPLLLCMVTRPERETPGWRLVSAAREIMGGSLTEIDLQALSEADSRQLVANLLRLDALPDSTRSLVLERAEGNPFFVEEVIRMLIDGRAILEKEGSWVAGAELDHVEIPDNLQGLLLARIDRLPDEVKRTLRIAAVIGRQFPVSVLEQVMREELL